MAEKKSDPEARVRQIRRKTRRRYSAEEKIRIVLEGLKGEESIAELCRREGISPNLYYNWSKEFLEAGKRRLMGDTKREATSGEVTELRRENGQLKHLVADLSLRNQLLKKAWPGWGRIPRTWGSGEGDGGGEAGDDPPGGGLNAVPAVPTLAELGVAPFARSAGTRRTWTAARRGWSRSRRAPAVLEPDPGGGAGEGGGEALAQPELSPRELAWRITDRDGFFISESSVYRILKSYDLVTSPAYVLISAKDRFDQPTRRVHELWQTDFTYFKVVGWGWYYLLTVLDDYSRYILAWKLFTGMSSEDVTEVLDVALERTGVHRVEVRHRPRLLTDNGPCFISKELAEYLQSHGMTHTRGKPYHPMTQGKIERYHRTMKNVVKLQNYYLPWELEAELERFVRYYNHERVHESLNNLTPADVYHGRGRDIETAREKLKGQTLRRRRRINQGLPVTPEERILPALYRTEVSLNPEPELSHLG